MKPHALSRIQLKGLGVDVVSLSRIKRLLNRHGHKAIHNICTPSERKKLAGRPGKTLKFAKFFAAKEAFFKSLDVSWMGVEGFKTIEIIPVKTHGFRIKSPWLGTSFAQGTFFASGSWVGAQVIRWGKSERKLQTIDDRP